MNNGSEIKGLPVPGSDKVASLTPTRDELVAQAESNPQKKKKGGRKGRPLRRAEEDVTGADYLVRLRQLGARVGESQLAFVMRLASVEAGRLYILDLSARCQGSLSVLSKQLGVDRHNLSFYLKQTGLETKDVLAFRE